jgi:predicted DNA-binding transcriptional regulator AlpA
MERRFLTTAESADILGMSERTLEGWRVRGGGPAYRRFGRSVRYTMADLLAWAQENTRRSTPTREPRPSA